MRKKVKEANKAIEEVRNKEEVKRRKDDTETRSKEGREGDLSKSQKINLNSQQESCQIGFPATLHLSWLKIGHRT